MSTRIAFPYQFKIIRNERIADPVIYLDVITVLGIRKIGFLVDSGADTVVLPLLPYQFWFNFNPTPTAKTTLGGVEGRGVTAYPGKINLKIGNKKLMVRCYFVKSNTMPLLGRLDLWKKFNCLFNNQREQVVFERI